MESQWGKMRKEGKRQRCGERQGEGKGKGGRAYLLVLVVVGCFVGFVFVHSAVPLRATGFSLDRWVRGGQG